MKTRFTRMGVKYRQVFTGPSRFSEGKVHLQFWSRQHREWVLVCRPGDAGTFTSYNVQVSEVAEPVTCSRCVVRDPRYPR